MRIAANVGAVGVNWRCYGTSNHKERQDGLCISDKVKKDCKTRKKFYLKRELLELK